MQQKGEVPFFLSSKYIGFGCDHYYHCYIQLGALFLLLLQSILICPFLKSPMILAIYLALIGAIFT